MHGYGFIFVLKVPSRFFALDEPVDRGVQRRWHADTLRFASDGARKKINLGRQLIADIVKHGRRVISHGANSIHFPGIFGKANASRLGHSLAFIDQRVQQMAEVGEFPFVGKVRRVRQARQSGDAIHRRIKNQLGPLRGPGVFERLGFETGGDNEIGSFFDYRMACRSARKGPSMLAYRARTARENRCGGCRS